MRLKSLLSEPLIQFLAVGALLLFAERTLAPASAADPMSETITVPETVLDGLRQSFVTAHGRVPDREELQGLIDRRIDAEVLYREAIRLGLDRADVIVRREMERKMRFLIEDLDPLAEPTREDLQAWLDAHPAAYAQPARVSFEQQFLSRARHGAQLPFVAAQQLATLRAPSPSVAPVGDPFPAGAVIRDADRRLLEKDFGRGFAEAVFALPPGEWSEPVHSPLGLHLVRVTARSDARPVSVEEAGKTLVVDVRAAQREAANQRALQALRTRYRIVVGTAAASPETAS